MFQGQKILAFNAKINRWYARGIFSDFFFIEFRLSYHFHRIVSIPRHADVHFKCEKSAWNVDFWWFRSFHWFAYETDQRYLMQKERWSGEILNFHLLFLQIGCFQPVFNNGQNMALTAFYFINMALTAFYFINVHRACLWTNCYIQTLTILYI